MASGPGTKSEGASRALASAALVAAGALAEQSETTAKCQLLRPHEIGAALRCLENSAALRR
jgi:hypothetical protein